MNLCNGCARCCEWPGVLSLTQQDIITLCEYLKMSLPAFVSRYTAISNGNCLLDSKDDGTCIFLEDKLCKVYQARPTACIEFPRKDQINKSLLSFCKLLKSIQE